MTSPLRAYLNLLQEKGELKIIEAQVDPTLELAEIHRQVSEKKGPALLFTNVKGSQFSVCTNLFGSVRRLELAFPKKPSQFIQELIGLLEDGFSLKSFWQKKRHLVKLFHLGCKTQKSSPLFEKTLSNLEELPFIKCWPKDGGHFLTLPLVYTESPQDHKSNLGIYRIQRYDGGRCGLHFQIGKGGYFHYSQAEALNTPLPVTIFLGGHPALTIAAIAPLPENISELFFASLLMDEKVPIIAHEPHPLLAEAECAIIGHANPKERALEGPFGDHLGTYGKAHNFPFLHVDKILARHDAIIPATVVGRPFEEDHIIGNWLQELFSPVLKFTTPALKNIWSYGEAGFHAACAIQVKERYEKEALGTAFSILGQGQLALTKILFVTDAPCDLKDFKATLAAILSRCKPETDLLIFSHTSNDTLDYSGPALNKGSKAILFGLGSEKRKLPQEFTGPLPFYLSKARPFCPGCLIIQGPDWEDLQEPTTILASTALANWPLLVLVDDIKKPPETQEEFLFQVFTRFEPAQDIYSKTKTIVRNQLSMTFPILIDARTKPTFPEIVAPDPEIQKQVQEKWSHYYNLQ